MVFKMGDILNDRYFYEYHVFIDNNFNHVAPTLNFGILKFFSFMLA